MRRALLICAGATVALCAPPAAAISITWKSTSKPYPGIVVKKGRTPKTDIYVATISLCTDYVHMIATGKPSKLRSAANWAAAAGVQLATNGDFFLYQTPPPVYGDAVGGTAGVRWPASLTGVDDTGGWYYLRYGWIAFGKNWVNFSHTKRVKNNAAALGVTDGWSPTKVTTQLPAGTKALISGFPELVVEGQQVKCSSPTASSCFPDRGDMRQRHPRTAMGLTKDRKTFFLVVVDGRTSSSAGMYGTELADLMKTLGAYVAFNLDGGGSSQMYVKGKGTIINCEHDSTGRAVANHWGVFAGSAAGKSATPGSCHNWPPNGSLDAADCSSVRGWAQDPDTPKKTIAVNLYFDGKPGAAGAKKYTVTADQPRQDLCDPLGSCNHGFSFKVPAAYKDGKPHVVHAYPVDSAGGATVALKKSPKTITCAPPPPGDGGVAGDGPLPEDGAGPQLIADAGLDPAADLAPGSDALEPDGADGEQTREEAARYEVGGGCALGGAPSAATGLGLVGLWIAAGAARRRRRRRR